MRYQRFKDFGVDEEFVDEETLVAMAEQIADTFFTGEMIPPYEEADIIHILMYYAQYEDIPKFYTFKDIDKGKLDVAAIAKHIWDEDMGSRRLMEFMEKIYTEEHSFLHPDYLENKKMLFSDTLYWVEYLII